MHLQSDCNNRAHLELTCLISQLDGCTPVQHERLTTAYLSDIRATSGHTCLTRVLTCSLPAWHYVGLHQKLSATYIFDIKATSELTGQTQTLTCSSPVWHQDYIRSWPATYLSNIRATSGHTCLTQELTCGSPVWHQSLLTCVTSELTCSCVSVSGLLLNCKCCVLLLDNLISLHTMFRLNPVIPEPPWMFQKDLKLEDQTEVRARMDSEILQRVL